MKSEVLDLTMKPGGRDLDRVNTPTPGTLEFIPNQAARHRRVLKATTMDIAYGAKSEIQSFHAVNASTETHPSDLDRKKKPPMLLVAYTSSKTIDAAFDDKGQLKQMKQAGDFKYSEGPRKAESDTATLESQTNLMVLDAKARVADDTGSTAGDRIELNQETGDFDARGHVSTTRLPDAKKTASDMLDKGEPTQGLADQVTSANRNHQIHYLGNAVLWQTSNRIQADKIDIDRDKKMLVADGQVVSQFQDNAKPPAVKTSIFSVVRAPHMVYTDADRQAVYSGGANFTRPSMTVKSTTLKAFLNDDKSDEDSRINHAFADGKVEIVETNPKRKRVGTSEHAEYYSDEGKVVLAGGSPLLTDSVKGDTRGETLTYFTDDEKLIVGGAPQKQTTTHLKKKKR
jgi:lipopolysaccharide export system protein LptA